MLLSDGVELVGTGSSCSRAELTLDGSYTLRVSVQHVWACTAVASKYERAHASVIALVDLFRCCTAEVHRESVNHSNVETGRKKEGGRHTRQLCFMGPRQTHMAYIVVGLCKMLDVSSLRTWRKRIA
jgi:hypothetical protein